jgi:hypothetical protein
MEEKLEAAHFTKFFHRKKTNKQNEFFPPKIIKSPTRTAGQRTKKKLLTGMN